MGGLPGGSEDAITGDFSTSLPGSSLDIPGTRTGERRIKHLARHPKSLRPLAGPLGNLTTPLAEEIDEDLADLLGNIGETPELPEAGSESERLRKKAASDRAKRKTGRQASIKTSSRGLPEDDELNIARKTLVG